MITFIQVRRLFNSIARAMEDGIYFSTERGKKFHQITYMKSRQKINGLLTFMGKPIDEVIELHIKLTIDIDITTYIYLWSQRVVSDVSLIDHCSITVKKLMTTL